MPPRFIMRNRIGFNAIFSHVFPETMYETVSNTAGWSGSEQIRRNGVNDMSERMTQNPAEEERERKKREKRSWEKILAYYMMQKWEDEQKRGLKRDSAHAIEVFMEQVAQGRDLTALLFEKKPGQKSLAELLEDMEPDQEEDSPFRKLLHTVRERPWDKQEVRSGVEDCIRRAPGRILERQRALAAENGPESEEKRAKEEQRLTREMCFLRGVMPKELYRMLCRELTLQGRLTDPERDFMYVPEREERITYEQYTERHRTELQERNGELANMDQVFTSAAYMMAAWEQRNEPEFDEKKADARAMEFFSGRAFRVYMTRHPGSLLAAARNTGLDIISADLTAMEAELARRDALLHSGLNTLKAAIIGKSAAYYRMTNSLDRYAAMNGEVPEAESTGLKNRLAEYVLTEGDPRHQNYDRACVLGAMRALKALTPEQDFSRFLTIVNRDREPAAQIDAKELDELPAVLEREAEPPQRELVLERRLDPR